MAYLTTSGAPNGDLIVALCIVALLHIQEVMKWLGPVLDRKIFYAFKNSAGDNMRVVCPQCSFRLTSTTLSVHIKATKCPAIVFRHC